MTAPQQGPIIEIPGIDDAKVILQMVRGAGPTWEGQLHVDGKLVRLNPESDWFDRSWFSLFLAEILRREKFQRWTYDLDPRQPYATQTVYRWTVKP